MKSLHKSDLFWASGICLAFFILYCSITFGVGQLDSQNILLNLLAKRDLGQPLYIQKARYVLSDGWFWGFHQFLSLFTESATSRTEEFSRLVWRSQLLNRMVGALSMGLLFLILRRFSISKFASLISTLLLATASTTIILATSTERQVIPVFFCLLAIYSASYATHSRIWVSSLAITGAFLGASFAMLSYLPTMLLFPLPLLLCFFLVLSQTPWKFVPKAFLKRSIPVLVICSFLLVAAMNSNSWWHEYFREIYHIFSHYSNPHGADYWTRVSHEIYINVVLTLSFFFTGIIPIAGVHKLGFLDIGMVQKTAVKLSGFIFILLMLTVVADSFLSMFKNKFLNQLKSRLKDPQSILQSFAAIFFLGGVYILVTSRAGVTSEFYYLYMWLAIIALSVSISRRQNKVFNVFWAILVLASFVMNLLVLKPHLSRTTTDELQHFLRIMKEVDIALNSLPKDHALIIPCLQHDQYWYKAASGHKLNVIPLDEPTFSQLKDGLHAWSNVYVEKEILQGPTTEERREYVEKNCGEDYESKLALLRAFSKKGKSFKTSEAKDYEFFALAESN